MKKLLLVILLIGAVVAAPVQAADTFARAVADGVIGTSAAAYRVKWVRFHCMTAIDAAAGTGTGFKGCYGNLRNGTGTSTVSGTNLPLLGFQANQTGPTEAVDLTLMNRTSTSNKGTGVLFSAGVYYDEITGSTILEIIYAPKYDN